MNMFSFGLIEGLKSKNGCVLSEDGKFFKTAVNLTSKTPLSALYYSGLYVSDSVEAIIRDDAAKHPDIVKIEDDVVFLGVDYTVASQKEVILSKDEYLAAFVRGFITTNMCPTGRSASAALCFSNGLDALGIIEKTGVGLVQSGETPYYVVSGSSLRDLLNFGATSFFPDHQVIMTPWLEVLRTEINSGAVFEPILYTKLRQDAVAPSKARATDSGYDLTILEAGKTVGDVTFYHTGISVEPPMGYYFDVVPRSSISKTGYMLANSVGIIDNTYRGELLVALRKVDPTAADLELPMRIAQLIPRRIDHFDLIEVPTLSSTERGDRGFGSSGK